MSKITDVLVVLDTANSPIEVIELPAVKANSLQQYKDLNPGGMSPEGFYELNRIAFTELLSDNERLAKCPRISIYNAWMELQASGLKLSEGECYIIAEKRKASDENPRAKFRISAKGKVQLMNRLPSIKFVHEPQLIREGDDYQFTNNPAFSVSHSPSKDPIGTRRVLFAYMILDTVHGFKTFSISIQEINAARDFSKGYKYNKATSPWTTHPDRMAVKTMINRVWNLVGEKETLHSIVTEVASRAEPEVTQDADYRIIESDAEPEAVIDPDESF